MKDQFDNTPLMLAVINDNPIKKNEKIECIQLLLQYGCNPNGVNKKTGFSSIHWAARYGNIEIVKLLCEGLKRKNLKKEQKQINSRYHKNKVKTVRECLPDYRGNTPLDYAGFFEHHDVVNYLISITLPKCKQAISVYANQIKKIDDIPDEDEKLEKILLLNPVIRSNLLYWACSLSEEYTHFNWKQIQQMICDLQAYPEAINQLDKQRTSIHSACLAGNWQKLKVIMLNIQFRYLQETETEKDRKTNKINPDTVNKSQQVNIFKKQQWDEFNSEYQEIFYRIINKFKINKFKDYYIDLKQKVKQLKEDSKNLTFDINFVDDDGLSGLHYACQFNFLQCAQILLLEHGLSIDLSGESGFRARELLHHSDIKSVFQQFYKLIDNMTKDDSYLESIGGNFKQRSKSILQEQYQIQLPTQITEHNLQLKIDFTNLNFMNKMCYRNLIDFYGRKYSNSNMLEHILKERQFLPEICTYALLVNIETHTQKQNVNSMIKSLITSEFTVRMFPSAANPKNQFFLLLELDQEYLQTYAQDYQYPIKLLDSNIKFRYIKKIKQKFEPFRSKDIQIISEKVAYNVVNIPEMIKKEVVVKSFFIHNFNEIADIEDKFTNTSIFQMAKFNFIDWKENEFLAFTAIKNYLGERWGFFYAFQNFYTTWLSLPSVLGLMTTVYVIQQDSFINLMSFSYAVFMMLWITVFINKWKRKENELKYLWGTIVEEKESKIRKSFQGYEQFSQSNDDVIFKSNSFVRIFWQAVNVLAMTIMISICVTSFLFSKNQGLLSGTFQGIELSKFDGVLNGVIIGATDFIYMKLATFLMFKENYLLENDYNDSFIKKIFIFKFINANVSLIWSVYDQRDLQILNTLLIGQISIKIFAQFVSRTVVPWLMGFAFKKLYFSKCRSNASNQQKVTNQYFKEPMYTRQQIAESKEMHNKKKNTQIFAHLKNQNTSALQWKRLVSVFDSDSNVKLIEKEPYLLDQVEINSKLKVILPNYELTETSNIFVLFGYVTMYSFICPALASMVFISNVLFSRFDRQAHLMYKQRLEVVKMNGLGAWVDVLGYLSYATVLSNCIFIYWFREQFIQITMSTIIQKIQNIFPETQINYRLFEQDIPLLGTSDDIKLKLFGVTDKNILEFIILIIMTEHILMFLRFLISNFIQDIPKFVLKKVPYINHQIEQLNHQVKDQTIENEIKEFKQQINRQRKSFNIILEKTSTQYELIQKEQIRAKQQLLQLQQEYSKKLQQVERINKKQLNKIEIEVEFVPAQVKGTEPKLQNLIENRFDDFRCPRNMEEELEFTLSQQLQLRMFRQTYQYIERHICVKRLTKLANSNNKLIINCVACKIEVATIQCHSCQNDNLCSACFKSIHLSYDDHRYSNINQETAVKEQKIKVINNFDKELEQTQWLKYEKFNYGLNKENSLFDHLRYFFLFMKESYMKINNINDFQSKSIDVVKMILDQNYNILGPSFKSEIKQQFQMEKDTSQIEMHQGINTFELEQSQMQQCTKNDYDGGISMAATLYNSKNMFNDEELLFLNRSAFYLLTIHGVSLKFDKFIEFLNILQNGSLHEKLSCVMGMLVEGRQTQKLVMVDHVLQFFMASMPQHKDQEIEAEKELLKLIGKKKNEYVKVNSVIDLLKNCKGNALEIVKVVLQV